MKRVTKRKSFTLVELMLTMALLAILSAMLIGNYITTLKRGRDQQRKNDLNQIQKALEMYYEDKGSYPTTANFPTDKFYSGTTVYMVKMPKDPTSLYTYRYESPDGTYYYLYSFIENDKDQGGGISLNGYSTNEKCDAAKVAINCRYYVSSSNAPTLVAN